MMQLGPASRRRVLAIAAASAAVAGGLAFWFPRRAREFHSVDVTGAEYARHFSLPDATGRLRTLAEFKGRLVALFFGFTQCPDVCPTTLTELTQVRKLLGPEGDLLQVIFITVDPQRDTPEVLRSYMSNFDPQHIALVPSPQQLAEVAREFKIYYRKVEGKTPDSYVMEHSAMTYIYDAQGRVRLYARYGTQPDSLASDLKQLIEEGREARHL